MIICPICDKRINPNESLVIRPIDNGTTDVMRVIHTGSSPSGYNLILHESDEYTRLRIDYDD